MADDNYTKVEGGEDCRKFEYQPRDAKFGVVEQEGREWYALSFRTTPMCYDTDHYAYRYSDGKNNHKFQYDCKMTINGERMSVLPYDA